MLMNGWMLQALNSPFSVTCNVNSESETLACVLNEHLTKMWTLLPRCESSRLALCVLTLSKWCWCCTQVAVASESFMQLNGQWWAYLSTHAVSYCCEQQHFMAQPDFRLTKHNTVMKIIKIPPTHSITISKVIWWRYYLNGWQAVGC